MNIIRIKTSEHGDLLGEVLTHDKAEAKSIFRHPFVLPELESFNGIAGFIELHSGGKRKTRTIRFEEIEPED